MLPVSWKKDKTVTGYQILISTDKNFKKGRKKITLAKPAAGKTVKGLKSRKKYYVKVRAYKKDRGNMIFGSFSKVKAVKVK